MEDFIIRLKSIIRDDLNKEYDKYCEECIEDLKHKLEYKRNDCIKSVLDNIDILTSQEPYTKDTYNIMIKIVNEIKLKE